MPKESTDTHVPKLRSRLSAWLLTFGALSVPVNVLAVMHAGSSSATLAGMMPAFGVSEAITAVVALALVNQYGLVSAGKQDVGYAELAEPLAAVIALRDGYTGTHGSEVSEWCRLLAEQLCDNPQDVSRIETAALIHDIGKVGVPDSVLHKPSALNAEEWEIIRQHPGWGATIVERVPRLKSVGKIIQQHHERWDGTGYPLGLCSAEIELGARIIAVVDAFHAMISDRPYRRALPMSHALTELREMAGLQFDPEVVTAFGALVDAGAIVPRENEGPRLRVVGSPSVGSELPDAA